MLQPQPGYLSSFLECFAAISRGHRCVLMPSMMASLLQIGASIGRLRDRSGAAVHIPDMLWHAHRISDFAPNRAKRILSVWKSRLLVDYHGTDSMLQGCALNFFLDKRTESHMELENRTGFRRRLSENAVCPNVAPSEAIHPTAITSSICARQTDAARQAFPRGLPFADHIPLTKRGLEL